MNSAINLDEAVQQLWAGELAIAAFDFGNCIRFVIDEKQNFSIDPRLSFAAMLERRFITPDQHAAALSTYRGGALVLTADNFDTYIDATDAWEVANETMAKLLLHGRSLDFLSAAYTELEKALSTGTSVAPEFGSLKCRLPSFYINFRRLIFRHTDWEQSHEMLVPPGEAWDSSAGTDFNLLIPDKFAYWKFGSMDLWKLQAY
ncbi:MAG: hypothetical protein KDH20_13950 [Rhodocyclaceae bacterium]|nr:hypothetical protein [Rhodocyclaceae bacterium]